MKVRREDGWVAQHIWDPMGSWEFTNGVGREMGIWTITGNQKNGIWYVSVSEEIWSPTSGKLGDFCWILGMCGCGWGILIWQCQAPDGNCLEDDDDATGENVECIIIWPSTKIESIYFSWNTQKDAATCLTSSTIMEKLAGVLCALHALPSAYAAQLLLWLGEEAGIFLQQKHKMTHGLYTFLHLGYTHIYIIIYNYTYIYIIL